MKLLGILGIAFAVVWLTLHWPFSGASKPAYDPPAWCHNDADITRSSVCSQAYWASWNI